MEILVALASFLTFQCLSEFLKKRFEKHAVQSKWLWRNEMCSLVHSTLSAILVTYSFFTNYMTDLTASASSHSRCIILFTIGYFAYDTIDMIRFDGLNVFVILCHHVLGIVYFSGSLWYDYYTSFCVLSLLSEWNTSFLHTRRLMKLHGQKNTRAYAANSVAIAITYPVTRFLPLCLILVELLRNIYTTQPLLVTLYHTIVFILTALIYFDLFNKLRCLFVDFNLYF